MTTKKTRVISGGHHIVRIDEEITRPLSSTDERNLLEAIRQIFQKQKVDVVIFEDYNKGVLTEKVIKTVTEWAIERNVPVAVDPKKDHFFSYKNSSLFKPNLKELKEGLKEDFDKKDFVALHKAIDRLKETLQAKWVMVTLSELGVMMRDESQFYHQPAHQREINDVSGAGDTVISVAALAMAAGAMPSDVAALSNIAGGLVCEKVGVVPVDKSQLLAEAVKIMA